MSSLKVKKINYGLIDSEPPTEKLVSEGDLLIKELSVKQRNTTISLQEQLDKPNPFVKSSEIIPLSQFSSGVSTLSDVITLKEHFNKVEYLKAAGLSDQDIELYLDSLNGFEFVRKKHKNWENNLLQQHIQVLEELVNQHKKTLESLPEKNVLKHGLIENGLTVKPDSTETKLLKFALCNSKETKFPFHQVINSIAEIEKNRFPESESVPSISKIRRKARKLQNRINNLKQYSRKTESATSEGNSKWDSKEPDPSIIVPKIVEKKVYSCSPINFYTIKNNEIVKLTEIKQPPVYSKLTLEEIRQLPKFKNFEPGNPSNNLYLKNLNNRVNEEDLKHLFKEYSAHILECKVLHGKLRGQAFIKFLNEQKATEALEDLNGTIIKNKPVIIQFSSHK